MTNLLERDFQEFQGIGMVEANINNEASNYMADNYNMILKQTAKMGVDQSKVEDLVHDVLVSIVESENNGCGYDISHSRENDIITVADFVFGRIKGYSRNSRYQANGYERRKTNNPEDNVEIYSASMSEGSEDNLDSMQRAYMQAPSFDEIDDVDLFVTLRKDIELCLDFNATIGFNIMNLFRNIDTFSNDFNASILEKLTKAVKYHDEFGEALRNVLMSAKDNREKFDMVIAEY